MEVPMLKAFLVNTKLGQVGMGVRDSIHLHKAAIDDLENVGTIANDMLARTLLERLCEDGRIFVDIGAHIGSVIGGALAHSNPSRLIAIEAIPEKAEALRKRFAKAEIIATAVSDHDCEVDFTIDLARPGYSSLNPDDDHQYEVVLPMRVAHTAPGMSLEMFLDAHRYPRATTNYFGIPRERRHQVRQRARKLLDFH